MAVNFIEGIKPCSDAKVGIVVSRFNSFICERLLEGALDTLKREGQVEDSNITVVRVPGAIEIPLTLELMAQSGKFDALIALGCVIRGATYHFEVVANECAKGITQVTLKNSCIVSNGVLTTNTIDEAIQRAGSKAGNKGSEAASAALEMINVTRQLSLVLTEPKPCEARLGLRSFFLRFLWIKLRVQSLLRCVIRRATLRCRRFINGS